MHICDSVLSLGVHKAPFTFSMASRTQHAEPEYSIPGCALRHSLPKHRASTTTNRRSNNTCVKLRQVVEFCVSSREEHVSITWASLPPSSSTPHWGHRYFILLLENRASWSRILIRPAAISTCSTCVSQIEGIVRDGQLDLVHPARIESMYVCVVATDCHFNGRVAPECCR